MTRPAGWLSGVQRACLLALAAATAPACGTCLLVVTIDHELPSERGTTLPVRLTFRPDGIGETIGEAARTFPVNLLFEVLDDVVWTPVHGIVCLFDGDRSVEGGFLGWLACFTPFATLTPGPYSMAFYNIPPVDAATLAQLRDADPEQRRAALLTLWPSRDLRDIAFR